MKLIFHRYVTGQVGTFRSLFNCVPAMEQPSEREER